MSNSAHTNDSYLLAGPAAVADQRAVGGEAGAEHGCCFVGWEAVGNGEDPGLGVSVLLH